MTRRDGLLVITTIMVLSGGLLVGWWLASRGGETASAPASEALSPVELDAGGNVESTQVFFPGGGGKLYPEPRTLPATLEGEARVLALLAEIGRGPTAVGLYPPLPPEVTVAELSLTPEGTLYLDLRTSDPTGRLAWGSQQELLAVYSLVSTLVLNSPAVERVVFMWNGLQQPTFAGHLDTTRPLGVDPDLLASLP